MCLELLPVSHTFRIYDIRFTCASHALSRAVTKAVVMQSLPVGGQRFMYKARGMDAAMPGDSEEHSDDDWGR